MEELARDGSAIKWADIRKAQEYHPEENPEGFLRLCEAYQVMLDCVQRDDAALAGQGESESARPLEGVGGTRGLDDGGGAGGRPQPLWRWRGHPAVFGAVHWQTVPRFQAVAGLRHLRPLLGCGPRGAVHPSPAVAFQLADGMVRISR